MNNSNTMLSIIVPAYNEEKNIEKCLRSIFKCLENLDINYEVLVINDGSTDRTSDIVKNLMKEYNNLRLIDRKENKGYGYTVIEGLREARGDIILYIDADCVIEQNSISKIINHFRKGADAVFGYVDVANPEYLHPLICKINKKHNKELRYGGALMAFRKDVLKDLGGPSLESGAGYDVELKIRLKRKGYNIIYEDHAKVYSIFPTKIKDILKRKYLAGKSYIVMSSKYPEIFKFHQVLRNITFYMTIYIMLLLLILQSHPLYFILICILIIIFLIRYTPKAIEIYKSSLKLKFLLLYYIYEFLSGMARLAGYLSEIKKLMHLIVNNIKIYFKI